MAINIRAKGANGELEISAMLEPIIRDCMREAGLPLPTVSIVQRNQNQSAVGGSDLTNTFKLCVEVKRQEALSINQWWDQVCAAAVRNEEDPVLLYRQNRKPWRCVMFTDLPLPVVNGVMSSTMRARAEISIESFLAYFRQWVMRQLQAGYRPRV